MLYLLLKPGSGNATPYFFKEEDKIIHFALFGIWSAVGVFNFHVIKKLSFIKAVTLIVVLGTVLAIGTELIQYWVPRRNADKMDVVADVCGVLAGIGFVFLSKKRRYNVGKKVES